MKEKSIETQIKNSLRAAGFWVTKVQSGMMKKSYGYRKGIRQGATREHWIHLADEGTPDLLACIGGRFVGIEVKKDQKEIEKWKRTVETDRRSASQHRQQQDIRRAGGFTLVVCSVEEVFSDLYELGLITKDIFLYYKLQIA